MAAFQYQCRMLFVVLWKSWRIRKHRKWQTLVEIAAPVLLVLLLVCVKAVIESSNEGADTHKPTIFRVHNLKGLITNLCNIGCSNPDITAIIAFAPKTNVTEEFMQKVETTLRNNEAEVEVHGFQSEFEIEALAALLRGNASGHIDKPSVLIAAVIFINTPDAAVNFVYKIRIMTSKFVTGKYFGDIDHPGPGKQYEVYETTGFLGLQLAVDLVFLELLSSCSLPSQSVCPQPSSTTPIIETQALPYPPYKRVDKFHYTMVVATLLPAAIIVGFVYMLSISIKVIIQERISGVKLFLTMLGLNNFGYWFGWFLDLFIAALLSVALIILLLMSDLFGGATLTYSSASLFLVFLILYLMAGIWFCFFIATLLNSLQHARALGAIIWIGTFIFPALLVGTKQRYLATQFLIAVLPNMCLYWGFNIIATWESRAVGVQWSNLEEYASKSDSLNLAAILAMLAFDGLLYFLLTVVMRNSHVNRRRLKRPFRLFYDVLYDDTQFPEFIHCFKIGCKRNKFKVKSAQELLGQDSPLDSPVGVLRTKILENMDLLYNVEEGTNSAMMEPVDKNDAKNCGVKIQNLTKSFHSDNVLKGFTCDFYLNEISCILGDGGSGKTVLIQILLGALKADEGIACVNNYDIHDYLTDVRRSVGFCPQQNMLFPHLTVLEHLLMFGWLKGKGWNEVYVQARKIVAILKLKEFAKVSAGKLNKTSKRLLSCAIAAMGDPKIMIFDAPTFEMDASSTKCFWTILNKYREGRTILFTSSSIEDAVAMADRIAIVNDGKLRCFGSSQYLNSVFGDGYTIKLSVSVPSAERLVRIICQEIEQAQVKNRSTSVSGEDVTFIVPEAYVSLFPKLFYQLFDHKTDFGVVAVEIDTLSVDDVFHSVHEKREFKAQPKSSSSNNNNKEMDSHNFFVGSKSEGFCLFFGRLLALLVKNYQLSHSRFAIFLFQVIIPLALIFSGINGANRGLRNKDIHHYGQIDIGLESYKNPVTLFSINDSEYKAAYQAVIGKSAKEVTQVSDYALDLGERDIFEYRRRFIAATQETPSLQVKVMYSTVPFNAPPLAVNLVTNALLKRIEPNLKIVVKNQPMRNSSEFEDSADSSATSDSSGTSALLKSICFYFAYAMALICAMVSLKPMVERASGSHHIQTMTGINPFSFWLSYFIVDGLYILLFSGVALLIVYFAQERYLFTMDGGAIALFLILYIGGLCCISFAYVFSQIVVSDSVAAFGWLNMLHLLAALGSYIMYHTHDGINDALSEFFFWATTPFPIPLLVHSLFVYGKVVVENSRCEFISNPLKKSVCNKTGLYVYFPAYTCCAQCKTNCFVPKDYFEAYYGFPMYTLALDLPILGFFALFYFILAIILDYNFFQKLIRYFLAAPSETFNLEKGEKDSSAAQEAERVRKLIGLGGQIPDAEGLLVDELCKNSGTVGVYSHVSFSVKKGECYGLLGLNGAGKSWVFRTLTGEIFPSFGDAIIPPYSLLSNRRQFCASIGYCPQNNYVLSGLTALQTLQLYGSLKGICKKDLMTEVNQWLSLLGLANDAHRNCGNCSLGFQRRLSVAIALIGNPKVIILDDPSRDIDPSMKKHIWDTLQRLQKDGKVILLASQNVRECEHMCGKLGLMINGRLQYVGTTREIKNKFLNGYTVAFKLTKRYSVEDSSDLETVGDIKAGIEAILDEAVYRDAFQNTLKYLIPLKDQNWGSIVEKLEKIRIQMSESVMYYSLTESTLDEVFNALADLDVESTNELPDAKVTICQRCCLGQCCNDDYS